MTIDRRGRQFARLSFAMLITVPVGLVFIAVWGVVVDTSPTLSDEDRIRGWVTVWPPTARSMTVRPSLCRVVKVAAPAGCSVGGFLTPLRVSTRVPGVISARVSSFRRTEVLDPLKTGAGLLVNV